MQGAFGAGKEQRLEPSGSTGLVYPQGMRTCPRCSEESDGRARFCSSCGEPLRGDHERRQERKYATALFADLVGSTALTESEDPEVVQAVIGETFDRLSQELTRYEGLVEKFMGDAVLAIFGVPRAHEDDAERAVRAALEMQATLSELNRSFKRAGRPHVAMRIGIESGEVLVDQDRASGVRDRMLTGDAVNVAARLQGAADPGRIVVGPASFAATKEVIEYRELPALDLKGKREAVPAWEALRVRAKQRGERPQLGIEAQLVGRGEELTVLKETFHRVQREGRPALVTIVGPAGVGKSRLVRELERHVDELAEFVYWRRGRSLAYGSTSYSALADVIKAQCEILEDDASDVVVKKAEKAVRELFGDIAIAPQIRSLVGAGDAGTFSREDLFDAWRRFLERLADRYPLTLVFEDIHWADAGLLDFIDHLADWAQGPILTVAVARPELLDVRPTWSGGKRNAATLYLDPLTGDEAEAMVGELLPGADSSELRVTIAERSEGNPLYVEEIVRKLIDDGILRASAATGWEVPDAIGPIELPRSIQALVAARIDGLPEDEKRVLQDASVVGRVFWAGAVAALSGQPMAGIRELLGRLRLRELIVTIDPSSFSDELEFAFRHALLRDGAYDSLPKSLRAEKHEKVAAWAVARAGDRAEEFAELVATHHLAADTYLDELGTTGEQRVQIRRAASAWARTAGDRALSVWLSVEAARWYEESLRLADELDAPSAQRAELARSLTRASFGSLASEIPEAACRRALALYEEAGDELGAGWAHAWLLLILLFDVRLDEARLHGDRAVELLDPLGPTRELAEALRIRGQFLWRTGEFEEAEVCSRRAAALAEELGAKDIRAAAIHDLAIELVQSGRTEEGVATMEEAFQLAKTAGDPMNLQRIFNNYASVLSDFASDFDGARAIAEQGLEHAERSGGLGWTAWLRGGLGELATVTGDLPVAESLIRRSIVEAEAAADASLEATRHVCLAWILILRGRIAKAEEAMLAASQLVERTMIEPQVNALAFWVEAMVSQEHGRTGQAVDLLSRAVSSLDRNSTDQAPWVLTDVIRVAVARDDRRAGAEAHVVLARGVTPYSRCHLMAANGLLENDPDEAIRALRSAAEGLASLGARIDEARVLLDLGRAERAAGEDPTSTFDCARNALLECDARKYLDEADAEIRRG